MHISEILDRCTFEDTGCVTWDGAHDGKGYPHCLFERRTQRVFRVLYQAFRGEIRFDLLHHACENRRCVNPWHIEDVTKSEHHAFKHPRDLRTHCAKGHELTPENTYVLRTGINKRQRKCRTCEKARKSTPEYLAYMRGYYQRRKQATDK